MELKEKLLRIQTELKAPKGQYNDFGGYKYRSCEDILEAVKPLLVKYSVMLTVSDALELIGDRHYIRATATLKDIESNDEIVNKAYAREDDSKKGMDGSQITGTASSYARKYALNGLFLIDDTKDSDTNEHAMQTGAKPKTASDKQIGLIKKLSTDLKSITDYYKVEKIEDLTSAQASECITMLKDLKERGKQNEK